MLFNGEAAEGGVKNTSKKNRRHDQNVAIWTFIQGSWQIKEIILKQY